MAEKISVNLQVAYWIIFMNIETENEYFQTLLLNKI